MESTERLQGWCMHMACFITFSEREFVIPEGMYGLGTCIKLIKQIALTMGSFKHS